MTTPASAPPPAPSGRGGRQPGPAAEAGGVAVATSEQISWYRNTFDSLVTNIGQALLGKQHVIRLAVTCLAAGGHLLLEDYPGTGKTSLARALASTTTGDHSRVQFTPDLLPSDVTGVTIYDPREKEFVFHPGPVFTNILLADEINRASPKTQSALLEVMEEGKVTVDGVSRSVGSPFMVIATQNPVEQAGTYRLPEAQLDRFLMKTAVGYPDANATVSLLRGTADRDRTNRVSRVMSGEVVHQLRDVASRVYVSDALLEFLAQVAEKSRAHPHVRLGLSVRGLLAYTHCAKAWAAAQGRNFVTPADLKDLALPIMEHRLLLDSDAVFDGVTNRAVIDEIFASVSLPEGPGQQR